MLLCLVYNSFSQEPSRLYLIVGVVWGVVLVVAAVMMVCLVGLGVYYHHKSRSGNYQAT